MSWLSRRLPASWWAVRAATAPSATAGPDSTVDGSRRPMSEPDPNNLRTRDNEDPNTEHHPSRSIAGGADDWSPECTPELRRVFGIRSNAGRPESPPTGGPAVCPG